MCSQVDSAAAHPQEHHESEAPHRAGDGEAGHRGLGGRGVRPHLRPPQPRPRTEGHHAGVNAAAPSTGEINQQIELAQNIKSLQCTNVCCTYLIFNIPFKCISISIQLP